MPDKKRGRPKKTFIYNRSKRVAVRMSAVERDRMKIAAKEAGMSLSDFIRSRFPEFMFDKK